MIKRLICTAICMSLIVAASIVIETDNSSLNAFTSANINKRYTVIIDAGHGGFDGGCIGVDGTLEKDLNLAISLKLEAMLKTIGFNTVMIRNTDTAVNTTGNSIRERKVSDIKYRHSLMEKYPNSIYLCIHQNKYSSPSVNGMQIFYRPNDEASKVLAEHLQNSITDGVGQNKKRPIKQCSKDVYLIYNANTTAVLIECGFLSNKSDLYKLKNVEYQKLLSFSIALGLINMLNET